MKKKLTECTKEELVALAINDQVEGLQDMSARELRKYLIDLESGKTPLISSWTQEELVADMLVMHDECAGCDQPMTPDNAWVSGADGNEDLVCEECAK